MTKSAASPGQDPAQETIALPRLRANGFDGLRLAAACLVIVGHAYPLTGHVSPALLGNSIQTIAVKVFFVISGALIAGSWLSDPDLVRFTWRRALRIFPGLLLVCVLTVFGLGLSSTSLTAGAYLSNPNTWLYFWNLALYPIYGLPGVFGHTVYGPAVNGSLWSLPVEITMYAATVLAAGWWPRIRRVAVPGLAAALLALSLWMVRLHPASPPLVVWGTSMTSFLDVADYFFAGAAIRILRLERFANITVLLSVLVVAAAMATSPLMGEILLALFLPPLVVAVGTKHFAWLERLVDRDYSYGLYLYGFPLQQLLVQTAGIRSPTADALLTLPVALLFAGISWHLVERPALRLKPARARSALGVKHPVPEAAA